MTEALASPAVFILHENGAWIPPLAAALNSASVPFDEWLLSSGSIDITAEPPAGIFWSRLSASAHTRGNEHAKEYARAVLRWLEAHGRRVINGSRVLELEVSKAAQYSALAAAGFDVPRTIVVFGADDLGRRARELPVPFITKHNQGGKGLGVRRFDSYDEFDAYVAGPDFEVPIDGITLLQELLVSPEPFVTRVEFVGGRFVYAVRVDTSAGSFGLCPAEACAVPEAGSVVAPPSLFQLRGDISASHPLVQKLEAFLADQGIEVAGIEFFETTDGRLVPYDLNTNTNYSPDVEAVSTVKGANAVASFLGAELAARYAAVSA